MEMDLAFVFWFCVCHYFPRTMSLLRGGDLRVVVCNCRNRSSYNPFFVLLAIRFSQRWKKWLLSRPLRKPFLRPRNPHPRQRRFSCAINASLAIAMDGLCWSGSPLPPKESFVYQRSTMRSCLTASIASKFHRRWSLCPP